MNRFIYSTLFITILFSCNVSKKISGPINVPNSLFTYTAEGNGIPCIIFTGSENVGHKMLPVALQEHFVFIHADPSNIDSTKINSISLDDILDDLERLRVTIGVEKIAILGHSMFGSLPLEYAMKYPENISYAISTGSVPFNTEETSQARDHYWKTGASDERKKIHKKNWEKLEETDLNSLSPSQRFITTYTANIPRFFSDPNFDMTPYWKGVKLNTDFLNHYGGTIMKDIDHSNKFKNIKCPVLVISGRFDFYAPYFLWEGIKKRNLIPDLKWIFYDNAGHNPFMEIPETFTNDVLNWLERSNY